MSVCKVCNQTTDIRGVQYCDECAEERFSLDLGLKYLEYKGLEEVFFLREVWEISTYFIDKRRLIEPLKEEFRQQVMDASAFSNRPIRLGQLKDYCFEDIDDWIEFLEKTEKFSIAV